MADAELGAQTGTYPTDYRRRRSLAVVLLTVGVVVTVPAVMFWVAVEERARKVRIPGDPLMLPTFLVALGGGLVLMGLLIGWWAVRSRGEVFRLHEHGLVHTRAGTSRTIRWADLDDVVVNPGRHNAFARWAGGDVSCTLKVRGGRNVGITGLTRNAEQLVQEVLAAHRGRGQDR